MTISNLKEQRESDDLRKEHNRDLIRRMRNGESLTSFDSSSSWFPPRPIIEKDTAAISRLYGAQGAEKSIHKTKVLQIIK